jgi:putative ABC transport system substrate-binding protein
MGSRMQFDQLKRRDFITLLGSAVAWPRTARAQQGERVRRVGVLASLSTDDPEGQARYAAFLKGMNELGWRVGQNVHVDYRYFGDSTERRHQLATELVGLAPDVIVATSGGMVGALQQVSRNLPIVFVATIDPVGSGFVDSLARPGGNATGFLLFEYSLSGKWLELLKQIAPSVTRAVVLRDTTNPAGNAQFGAIQAVAPSLGVEVRPANMRDANEIEHAFETLVSSPSQGLIVTGSPSGTVHRNLIVTLAAQHKLPAVYPLRFFATAGGLISYGPDIIDQYYRAAAYVDRILKGEKPADLPVQAPTKYGLAINLKTAIALGVHVPATLLATADEVIE